MMLSKHRIEDYKKRVEDTRLSFEEQQQELTERIEIFQNTIAISNFIKSTFLLEYRLLLELSENDEFGSGRRKADLEKRIESCGCKSDLQSLTEPPTCTNVLDTDLEHDSDSFAMTEDNSLNLFNLMSQQKQYKSVDDQVDRALQEAREFLQEP